ncbi:MAG: hypothetical protein J5641_04185, partial [Bacteroidales bacterium]|nr:hypothetical protein [Bacteroidales bacterium]
MMEEIQNIGQPEGMPEVTAAENTPEAVVEVEQPEQEPNDAAEDAPEENGHNGLWDTLKEFMIKRKRPVIYAAVALVVVVVAILIIHRNQVGKNRYETLVQT